jgi:hypothetical protein
MPLCREQPNDQWPEFDVIFNEQDVHAAIVRSSSRTVKQYDRFLCDFKEVR